MQTDFDVRKYNLKSENHPKKSKIKWFRSQSKSQTRQDLNRDLNHFRFNSPLIFQTLVSLAGDDYDRRLANIFDDFSACFGGYVFSASWEEHIILVQCLFQPADEYQIAINVKIMCQRVNHVPPVHVLFCINVKLT